MPDIILPPGYRASLVGQASSLQELSVFEALEQDQPEESRMLAQLVFRSGPAEFEHLAAQLNQACLEAGVSPWPEHQNIAFADAAQPAIYICWQKGLVWWGWILAMLGSLVLPPLLMAALWLVLPESIKQMVEAVTYLGVMGIAMFVMSRMFRGVAAPEEAR